MHLHAYGLVTAAGNGTAQLWSALCEGRDCASVRGEARACFWPQIGGVPDEWSASSQRIKPRLDLAVRELAQSLNHNVTRELATAKIALIVASTKGYVDDFANSERQGSDYDYDPFAGIVRDSQNALDRWLGVRIDSATVVSTACTSAVSAMAWAEILLRQDFNFVFVVAADAVGPFVYRGFRALKALSPDSHRPFSADRAGLQLGEAAGVALFSLQTSLQDGEGFEISSIAIDCEGGPVTRPSANGRSLERALNRLELTAPPDAIIAHATATQLNDAAEAGALARFDAPIMSTKWSIGHSLGASGLVDLVVACEMLRHQRTFSMATTQQVDPALTGNFLVKDSPLPDKKLDSIVITSLGFGGMQAALVVEQFVKEGAKNFPRRSRLNFAAVPKLGLRTYTETISLPLPTTPGWAARTDRWSQLDGPAQALCEAYARLATLGLFALEPAPRLQFFASPFGCNESDLAFVASGYSSPAKFVHTLPNIRCAPLLQLMEWTGPVFCVQSESAPSLDPLRATLVDQIAALRLGAMECPVWTWSVRPVRGLAENQKYQVTWCRLSTVIASGDIPITSPHDLNSLSLGRDIV